MYIDRFIFYNYNGVKIKGQNFFSQKKFFYQPKLRHWIFYSLIFLLCFIQGWWFYPTKILLFYLMLRGEMDSLLTSISTLELIHPIK
jgi:hypothetical protein